MIYGRSGNVVYVSRRAVLEDVLRIDKRRPDRADKVALAQGSYWIVCDADDGRERLYHLAYLRADGGAAEITAACAAVEQRA
jgi:hypothetical protein